MYVLSNADVFELDLVMFMKTPTCHKYVQFKLQYNNLSNILLLTGDESDACSYMATEGYTAKNEDEVTFPKNAVLTVTWRSMDGWWKATYNGHTGLVPSSHLAPFEGQQDDAAVVSIAREAICGKIWSR